MLLLTSCPDAAAADNPPLWSWVQWNEGEAVARTGRSLAAELPADPDLRLLVPVEQLSWHRVNLPKVPLARLRATLEGLLEDQLLDDPAQLHFALADGVRPDRGAVSTWVAVCSKAWLRSTLAPLESAGRVVSQVLPQSHPSDLGRLDVRPHEAHHQLVASGPQGVLACSSAAWDGSARTLVQATLEGATSATGWCDPASAGWAERAFPDQSWTTASPAERAAHWAQSPWNLAQGEFRPSGGGFQGHAAGRLWHALWTQRAWRPLRWGVLTLVLLQVLGLNLLAWRQQHTLQTQRAELRSLLTQAFPQITLVLDAPLQMQRELDRLRQSQGDAGTQGLEALLQTLATAAPGAPLNLQAISYQAGAAQLQWASPPAQEAELLAGLQAAGWQAQTQGNQWQLKHGVTR